MQKLKLSEWAAVGEIIASAAVVVSLLVVAYNINRNNEMTYGSMENLIFEQHMELANHVMADPSLAEILAKMRGENPQLSDIEAVRWEKYQTNMLDIWAMAYMRQQADLLGEDHWRAWDGYFTGLFRAGGERVTKQRWEELKFGYDQGFWAHVNVALFGE